MTSNKIAFVASGGGMSCAYSAGVAQALQEKGIRPDIFIGSSGSAGTVSYFACGRADVAATLWKEEVTNPRVIQKSPLRLDVDFIIDSMQQRFPLDETALRDPSVELFLATTNYRTVRTRFFSNHDDLSWYEVMRASMAIPFVYGRQVTLGGENYFDGDISTTLADCITLAQERGAATIYVCDTGISSYLEDALMIGLRPLLTRDFLKSALGLLRRRVLVRSQPNDVRIVYLRPSKVLLAKSLNNSKEVIGEALDLGYAEAKLKA